MNEDKSILIPVRIKLDRISRDFATNLLTNGFSAQWKK